MRYWYKYKFHGLGIGFQPKDFVSYDQLIGKFGAVSYERKLTEKEIEEYDLELVVVEGDK